MRHFGSIAFLAAAVAAAIALNHPTSMAGVLVTAPGYLLQAWLFERHWALGGAGYVVTMVGVSAVFWAGIMVGAARLTAVLARRFFHRAV